MRRRRDSHSAVDELAKETRRRGVSAAGVGKDAREKKRRRSTLGMGVLGDTVFIPGSPATTLPQLLAEAEAEVVRMSPVKGSLVREGLDGVGQRDPFKTPLPSRVNLTKVSLGSRKQVDEYSNNNEESRERIWTKEDWKQLDGCFTDERLAIGHRLPAELARDGLAPVDMVQVSDVVERFLVFMGGLEVVETFGDAWERYGFFSLIHLHSNIEAPFAGIVLRSVFTHYRISNVLVRLPRQQRLMCPVPRALMHWKVAPGYRSWKFLISPLLVDGRLRREHFVPRSRRL